MLVLAGLRGQSMAGPLLRPGEGMSRGLGQLLGLRLNPATIPLSRSPGSLDVNSTGTSFVTPLVTVTPRPSRRGEAFSAMWAQRSGIAGTAAAPNKFATSFSFSIGSTGTYPQVWRCQVANQYGEFNTLDVAFTLTKEEEPPPALTGTGSPPIPPGSEAYLVPIDPVTRQATVSFSASVSGGVPPYSYDWGGGDTPNSASNSATFTIPPGGSAINFGPVGCTVTDSASQSIVVGAGRWFIYEGI